LFPGGGLRGDRGSFGHGANDCADDRWSGNRIDPDGSCHNFGGDNISFRRPGLFCEGGRHSR
jgi:hypothetical protein